MYAHPAQGSAAHARELRIECGRWLKEVRYSRGLTQLEVALMVEYDSYPTIAQIEQGKARIPPDRYALFARALGMNGKVFMEKLLSYYDPFAHRLLFKE